MTGRRIVFIAFVLFSLITARASALSVSASVDSDEVTVGDPINLTVTITGKGSSISDPELPDLPDFDIYSSGRNSSFSLINGEFLSSLELSYTLIPKKVGVLTIGRIVVRGKGAAASTDPIKITVKEQGAITDKPQSRSRSTRRSSSDNKRDFFIEQAVDKTRPYVSQQVTLTFRFYQAVTLWDQPTLEWPNYTGVTIEDLPPNTRTTKYVDGRLYQITEIKRALFPLSSGEVVLGTPRLTIKGDNFGRITDPFSLFDRDLFGRGKPVVLTTSPIKLKVKSLPIKGKPDNFKGAVGNFVIRALVDKDSVGVDEPITLKVILSGTGDLKSLPQVSLPEFTDFRVYESGKNESINQQGGKISGTRTFEMALIPKTSGEFTIPALEYSFFNPSGNRYEIIHTKPIKITASGEGLVDVGGAPKNIIDASRQSFGYIITDFPESDGSVDLAGSAWFWFLQTVPAFGIGAALILRSRYRKLLGDKSYARRISAGRRSRSIFKTAYSNRDKGDFAEVCGDLYDAVLGFVADRLDLPKAGLVLDDLAIIDGFDAETRKLLIGFLEDCQNARFTPSGIDRNTTNGFLKRGEALITRLEKSI